MRGSWSGFSKVNMQSHWIALLALFISSPAQSKDVALLSSSDGSATDHSLNELPGRRWSSKWTEEEKLFESRTSTERFEDFQVLHVIDDRHSAIPILSMLHSDADSAPDVPAPRSLSLQLIQKENAVNHANAIHNNSQSRTEDKKRGSSELSDVSLDDGDLDLEGSVRRSSVNLNNMFFPRISSKQERPFMPTVAPNPMRTTPSNILCHSEGLSYKVGEVQEKGCSEKCTCSEDGTFECAPRCSLPFYRRGARLLDPLCSEKPVSDPCCALHICQNQFGGNDSSDIEHKGCLYKNVSYSVGATFHNGCEETCMCQVSGSVTCHPRCPAHSPKSHCVLVQDPKDNCCRLELCDVAVEDSDTDIDRVKGPLANLPHLLSTISSNTVEKKSQNDYILKTSPIASAVILPNNTLEIDITDRDTNELELSRDGGRSWVPLGDQMENIEGNKKYLLRTNEREKPYVFSVPKLISGVVKVIIKRSASEVAVATATDATFCDYHGQRYKVGEEFHNGCAELCLCLVGRSVECAAIHCPSNAQLDVLYPGCIKWRPKPSDFQPIPPKCCPPEMECVSNGSCTYKGHEIPNWTEVPTSLTGCERRCFCESGEIDCQNVCVGMTAKPPDTLKCPPRAVPVRKHPPGDDCCLHWTCSIPDGANVDYTTEGLDSSTESKNSIPIDEIVSVFGTAPPHRAKPTPAAGLQVLQLESDTPTSVKLVLNLPSTLVGLQGRVQVQYIKADNSEDGDWSSRVFTPVGRILNTMRLELRLSNLEPDTEYAVRSSVLPPLPPLTSIVQTVHTKSQKNDTQVPAKSDFEIKEVDASIRIVEINSSSARLEWRRFLDEELGYIDGIQIRYRQSDIPIFMTTPLLHRLTNSYSIGGLKSNTSYVFGLLLIPPLGARMELRVPTLLSQTTPPYIDMYNFSVTIEAVNVMTTSLLTKWSGIPVPEAKFVTVYRVVCQPDVAQVIVSANQSDSVVLFKLTATARMEEPVMTVGGLLPGTRYRVWLELYLTNGRTKTSNVLDIVTSPGDHTLITDKESELTTHNGKIAGKSAEEDHYYGPLVGTAVIAVLAVMAALLLLLALLRRHRPHTATITAVGNHNGTTRTANNTNLHASMPPYDPPTYKLELQQETMNL